MLEGVDEESAGAASAALGDSALQAAGAAGDITRALYRLSFAMAGPAREPSRRG
jgi:hypothetical protein